MGRLTAASCAALLAWCIGKALGVPVWRDWDIGDRTDLAVLAFALVWWSIAAISKALSPNGREASK